VSAISATPLLVAGAAALLAPRSYAIGMWEAIPWLFEAQRTLAGPPRPDPLPAWVGWLRDPWLRLVATQFVRTTPLPHLRGAALLAWISWSALREPAPSGPALAVGIGLVGLWIAPSTGRDAARARARLAGALPLPAHSRRGGAGLAAICLFAVLPVAAVVTVLIRLATA
jgi:hypothetical protein